MRLLVAVGGIWTHDFQFMRLTSYLTALPRDISFVKSLSLSYIYIITYILRKIKKDFLVPRVGLEPTKCRFWICHVCQFRHQGILLNERVSTCSYIGFVLPVCNFIPEHKKEEVYALSSSKASALIFARYDTQRLHSSLWTVLVDHAGLEPATSSFTRQCLQVFTNLLIYEIF